jgi:hypothetical protein
MPQDPADERAGGGPAARHRDTHARGRIHDVRVHQEVLGAAQLRDRRDLVFETLHAYVVVAARRPRRGRAAGAQPPGVLVATGGIWAILRLGPRQREMAHRGERVCGLRGVIGSSRRSTIELGEGRIRRGPRDPPQWHATADRGDQPSHRLLIRVRLENVGGTKPSHPCAPATIGLRTGCALTAADQQPRGGRRTAPREQASHDLDIVAQQEETRCVLLERGDRILPAVAWPRPPARDDPAEAPVPDRVAGDEDEPARVLTMRAGAEPAAQLCTGQRTETGRVARGVEADLAGQRLEVGESERIESTTGRGLDQLLRCGRSHAERVVALHQERHRSHGEPLLHVRRLWGRLRAAGRL